MAQEHDYNDGDDCDDYDSYDDDDDSIENGKEANHKLCARGGDARQEVVRDEHWKSTARENA